MKSFLIDKDFQKRKIMRNSVGMESAHLENGGSDGVLVAGRGCYVRRGGTGHGFLDFKHDVKKRRIDILKSKLWLGKK